MMGNKQMASPLEISIALHYHCRANDYGRGNGDNNFNAPAVKEALDRFFAAGLLISIPGGNPAYRASPGLGIYVKALCGVDWPRMCWSMPVNDGYTAADR